VMRARPRGDDAMTNAAPVRAVGASPDAPRGVMMNAEMRDNHTCLLRPQFSQLQCYSKQWEVRMGNSDLHLTLGIIIGVATMLMFRLDRLGKQLEAVSAMVRADLAHTEEERSEVLQEWKETKKQAAKDERQFWLFWFVVVAALGLYFNYFR
jgi:hypothetical protein